MHLESFYTSVYDQCSSPCGKFLACCSNFGRISIFNLQESTTSTNEIKKPYFTFKTDSMAYCLVTCEDLLVCGLENGVLRMFSWKSLIKKNSSSKHHLPCPSNNQGKGISSLCTDGDTLFYSQGSLVYRCGVTDEFAHQTILKGHSDYIHSIQAHKKQLHSASEDGLVLSWDTRSNKKIQALVPSDDDNCSLHDNTGAGKWVKSIAVCEERDYMVCGGGFRMSLWYPGYKKATTVFNHLNNKKNNKDMVDNVSDKNKTEVDDGEDGKKAGFSKGFTNHIILNSGTIMSCGDSSDVTTWATNGDVLSTLPCSSFNLYNIHVNQLSPRLLTVAGSSNNIDACINFNYKSFNFHMI